MEKINQKSFWDQSVAKPRWKVLQEMLITLLIGIIFGWIIF